MYLCRAASQALAARLSRAPSAAGRLQHRAPLRQMSSGSVPGSSGENMIYYLLAGVAAFSGLFYTYRTVGSSRSNYIEHMHILQERAEGRKSSYRSGKGDEEETAEAAGEDTATEEAAAANSEVAANSEAAAAQETVSEVLDVAASSDHEENLDSVEEGVASAAQEMSDTASRNQDADAEESGQTSEVSVDKETPEEIAKEP
uniref:Mitochondria localized glutamic acid rich protein n=1 Tax=Anas platyrhynchos platyrhynchos TaxID=8840 RepID=A0A493TZ16_ANAPP